MYLFQKMFGNDLIITDGGQPVGTKHIDDYGSDISESDIANDPDLDISTCKWNYCPTNGTMVHLSCT